METKTCKRCEKQLPASDFYATDTSCKECRKECVREYRKKNIEKIREYDRGRGMLPHRVKARKRYEQTPAGKAAIKRAHQKQNRINPVKRGARIIVGNALRDGRITRPSNCQDCGERTRLHGHHDDYARPMDVRWLCAACHHEWHAKHGQGLNG